jgi:hypothetical protein
MEGYRTQAGTSPLRTLSTVHSLAETPACKENDMKDGMVDFIKAQMQEHDWKCTAGRMMALGLLAAAHLHLPA